MLHQFRRPQSASDPSVRTARSQRIYKFLHDNPVGVLSSISPDGEPHGAAIYFDIDKHFAIRFLTKTKTHKYANLKQHDHVMFTVFEPLSQTTVQLAGVAREILDNMELNSVAGAIVAAAMRSGSSGLPPISKLLAGQYAAFKILPTDVRMAVYTNRDAGGYEEYFETLESFD